MTDATPLASEQITQEDREAAAKLYEWFHALSSSRDAALKSAQFVRTGGGDGWNTVQLFARHRIAAGVEVDAKGEAMVCTGCGTTRTVAAIRASSATAFTCCPERKMIAVRAALSATPAPSDQDASQAQGEVAEKLRSLVPDDFADDESEIDRIEHILHALAADILAALGATAQDRVEETSRPLDGRKCTCDPADRPEECQRRFAATECQFAASGATAQDGVEEVARDVIERCSFCDQPATTSVADDSDTFDCCGNCEAAWQRDPGFVKDQRPTPTIPAGMVAKCLTPGCKYSTEIKTTYAHSSYGNARLGVTVLLPEWQSLKVSSKSEIDRIEHILHAHMERAVAEIGQYDLSLGGDVAKDWPTPLAAAPKQAEQQGVDFDRAALVVTDGFRCRTCKAVFVSNPKDLVWGGHPDNGCAYPNWDKLSEAEQADAIRALNAPTGAVEKGEAM